MRSFNPHTHAGCDTSARISISYYARFNPHTHAGCDLCYFSSLSDNVGFNPHTHAGCDSGHTITYDCGAVSIHTPTQGVTLYLITYYKSANLIHCYANHHYYSTS